jgi:hypothetical protein
MGAMSDRHHLAFPFDVGDPQFEQQWFLWTLQMRSEMMETVMRAREAITSSRELLAKLDQCARALRVNPAGCRVHRCER